MKAGLGSFGDITPFHSNAIFFKMSIAITLRNAAHEVGHFYFARRQGLEISYLTIRHGAGFNPQTRFDISETRFNGNVDYWFGGWAAEAYMRSHDRNAVRFRKFPFLLSVAAASYGAGWPSGLAKSNESDTASLRQTGGRWWQLIFPLLKLVRLAKTIHSERELFYRLIDYVRLEISVTGEMLSAVADKKQVTSAMRSNVLSLDVFVIKDSSRKQAF
ncbi:hypothetical protein [Rhizobium sp.]|uniref:hypothetical protein n=1 Tax=Rhizobium sp. TaxID=391 RepID=UPI00289A832F